jgi:AcrR family transcriptional regulator
VSTTTEAPRRSDAARNRALVLETARERLDHDFELPPMKDLARLAGVGVGTVYRHFPTQQALLAELGTDASRRLVDETRAAAAADDPAAGFARILGFVLRGLVHDPAVCAALTGVGGGCAPTSGPAAELNAGVETLLRRAREAGAIRDDVDADDIRLLLVGVASGLRLGDADDERLERHLRVLVDGLRRTPEGSER